MLVLTRRLGESLFIEKDGIRVVVSPVEVNRYREVRFFIGAPRSVVVQRKHHFQRMTEEIVIDFGGGAIVHISPLNVNGRQVKVGAKAPTDIDIVREEIYNKPSRKQSNEHRS